MVTKNVWEEDVWYLSYFVFVPLLSFSLMSGHNWFGEVSFVFGILSIGVTSEFKLLCASSLKDSSCC